MEGVAGISRPPPTALSGGAGPKLAPFLGLPFRWKTPPSVGRAKGGEVPQLHRPLF